MSRYFEKQIIYPCSQSNGTREQGQGERVDEGWKWAIAFEKVPGGLLNEWGPCADKTRHL